MVNGGDNDMLKMMMLYKMTTHHRQMVNDDMLKMMILGKMTLHINNYC